MGMLMTGLLRIVKAHLTRVASGMADRSADDHADRVYQLAMRWPW